MCRDMSSCDAGGVAKALKDTGHFLLGACLVLLRSLDGGLHGNWNAAAPKGAAANDDECAARAPTATASLLPARVRLRCGQQFMCNQERRFSLAVARGRLALQCSVPCSWLASARTLTKESASCQASLVY